MVGGIGGNGGPGIKGVGTPLKAQESFGAKFKRFLVRVAAGIARAAFAIAQPVQSLLGLIDRIAIRSRSARVGRAPEDAPRAARALRPERGPGGPLTADQQARIGGGYKAALRAPAGGGLTKTSDVDGRVCGQFVRDVIDGRGGIRLIDRDAGTDTALEPAERGDEEGQKEKIGRFVEFCGEDLSFAVSQFANQDTQNRLAGPMMDVLGPDSLRAGGGGARIPYELVKQGGNYNLSLTQSFAQFSCTIEIPLTRSDGEGGIEPIPRGEIEPRIDFRD